LGLNSRVTRGHISKWWILDTIALKQKHEITGQWKKW
jgi:hypothetical protein